MPSQPPSVHWARVQDAWWVSALLSRSFGPVTWVSRARFAAKVVLVPHLVSAQQDSVIGIEPLPKPTLILRLRSGLRWALVESGQPFATEQLPEYLQAERWRVVNVASMPSSAPAIAVALVRRVETLADRFGRWIEVEMVDPRLRQVCERHGFVLIDGTDSSFARGPRTSRRV